MRHLALGLAFVLSLEMLSTTVVRGAPPTGSVTPGPNRTMTVCVNDPEDPPGTSETIELFIDHGNYPYDRFTLADGSCTTRGYAPFGPSTHPLGVKAIDASGQESWLYLSSFAEDCNAFPAGSANQGFCNAYQSYYQTRQQSTWPLFSNHVWAGVSTGFGGAIQQLYSADRSFNLLMEHPGGAMQLSLWSGDAIGPEPPPFESCNGAPNEGRKMNVLQTAGPECTYGHPMVPELSTYYGPAVGALVNTVNADNHLREWTIQNFRIGQLAYIRPDHLEVTYRFINWSPWEFTLADQEIPAVHLNDGMNDRFYWGTGGYSFGQSAPHGASAKGLLYVPAIGPPPNPGVYGTLAPWTASWATACDAVNHCITVAPHDPPSTAGIHMAQVFSNINLSGTQEGTNMISLLGRFAITQGMDKTIKLYVFPHKFDAVVNGISIRDRLQQLRGWL